MDYSKFDSMVDVEGLKSDIEKAKARGGQGLDVPNGEYEVEIVHMELKESSKGDPMVTIWFDILSGEYEGERLFMNQLVTKGFQVHIMNEFLRSLGTTQTVEFSTFAQYGALVEAIFNETLGNKEYAIEVGERKGFPTFKVTQIFELE